MEKRNYVRPILNRELFSAENYIAACKAEYSYVGYCNISGPVYLDTNENGVFDPGIDQHEYDNTACNRKYESTIQPHTNAFVVIGLEKKTTYCDNPSYSPTLGIPHHIGHNCEKTTYTYTSATPVFNYEDVHVTANYDTNLHKNLS